MAFFPANFMLQTPHHEEPHQSPPSLNTLLPSCTSQEFHAGVPSFLGKRSMSISGFDRCEEAHVEDELSDDGSHMGEKKRRLNMEQVKTLEKNFELGNKLEPERKMQLARALGLQPRQIAIWFQNRRARWKTKQLEKDYDLLKRQFEAVKSENEALQAQNQKLQAEIMALKNRDSTESINLNIKETEGSCSNRSENSSEMKLEISRAAATTTDDNSPLSSQHHHHHHHGHPTSRAFFPVAQQLFQDSSSSRPSHHHDHHNQLHQIVKEESFTNMFCAVEDQSGFWPWLEQQNFN